MTKCQFSTHRCSWETTTCLNLLFRLS